MISALQMTPENGKTGTSDTIVYFDGVCGMCNQVVNFLMTIDPQGKLRFAPLQGETAKENLPAEDIAEVKSLVVSVSGKTFRHSAAVIRILKALGGKWSVFAVVLWMIPRPLRDLGYRMISRYRYRIFGKHETCRLPTPEERARFLP
jgi:predicted DCC family thiol-disulfide oxidoreductase YuxK